jgi:hypothetical protein
MVGCRGTSTCHTDQAPPLFAWRRVPQNLGRREQDPAPSRRPRIGIPCRLAAPPILSRPDGAGSSRHSGPDASPAAKRDSALLHVLTRLRSAAPRWAIAAVHRCAGYDSDSESQTSGRPSCTGYRFVRVDGMVPEVPSIFCPLDDLFGLLVLPLVSVACGHATLEMEHAVALTTLTRLSSGDAYQCGLC